MCVWRIVRVWRYLRRYRGQQGYSVGGALDLSGSGIPPARLVLLVGESRLHTSAVSSGGSVDA